MRPSSARSSGTGPWFRMGERDPGDVRDGAGRPRRRQLGFLRLAGAELDGRRARSTPSGTSSAVTLPTASCRVGSRAARHAAAAAGWLEAKTRATESTTSLTCWQTTTGTALELSRSAGGDAGHLVERAVRFLALAGDRALALDVPRAERSYGRALELLPPEHPDYAQLLMGWGQALTLGGRYEEAIDTLERAAQIHRDRKARVEAARALLLSVPSLARFSGAREQASVEEAIGLLEGYEPGSQLVEAYVAMAGIWYRRGVDSEAIAWAERALALAHEIRLAEPARALSIRGGARVSQGEGAGREDLERALELALARGLGRETAIIYNHLGLALATTNGPAHAIECLLDRDRVRAEARDERDHVHAEGLDAPPALRRR